MLPCSACGTRVVLALCHLVPGEPFITVGGEARGTRLQHAVGMAGDGTLRNTRSSDGSGGQSVAEETDGRSGMVPTLVALNDYTLLTLPLVAFVERKHRVLVTCSRDVHV